MLILLKSFEPQGQVVTGHVASTATLFPPTVFQVGVSAIITPVLGSTVQMFPPRISFPFVTNTRRIRLLVDIGMGNNGKSLRRTLSNQADIVGLWFHAELVSDHGSRDYSAHDNHGTYEGTGYVRGISVTDLPEGGIATHFDGSQQVRIPNDGLTAGMNLSLAGGGFDIYIYFRTSTNDSNQRAVISKLDNSTGTGWYVQLQNGIMTCRLLVAGIVIFTVSTDFIADNNWHRAAFCYEPEINRASAHRDGALRNTTTGSTEPSATASDVIVAGWSHLTANSTRYVGDLYAVMVGREGNFDLPSEAEQCIFWADVSAAVKGLEVEIGDTNQIPFGSTATTGRASFRLTNANPLGRFSPGHVNAAFPGFGLSRPVRIRTDDGLTIRPLFRGFISDITPATGDKGERTVSIDCVDWMEVLAVTNIGAVEIVRNQTSSYCLSRLIDQMVWPPSAVSIDVGDESFPFAFDQIEGNTRALQEISEITRCEGGATFIKRDGTFVFQARQRRQLPTAIVATFANDWQEMDARQGLDHVINIQRATVYPRESGNDVITVLTGRVSAGATKRRQEMVPGVVAKLEGSYSDPEERSASVGGMDMQLMIGNIDYTMTSNQDGTGEDLTAYVQILSGNPPKSGSTYSIEAVNTHPFLPGWLHWQIRGRILRRFDPVTTLADDIDSINEHLPREGAALSMRYLSSVEAGRARAQFLVSMFKSPKTRAHSATALVNINDSTLSNYLLLDIGNSITITETMSAITAGLYWVQGLRYSFDEYNVLRLTVNIVPAAPFNSVFIVGDTTYGVVGTAILGY